MKHCSSVVGELQVRLRMGIVPEQLCYEARKGERRALDPDDEMGVSLVKAAVKPSQMRMVTLYIRSSTAR